MSGVEELASEREYAFEHLVGLLKTWTEAGRKTTTAGVTSAMKQDGALDLSRLGYKSNADFWEAAEHGGFVRRTRLLNGHWYVTLAGASPPVEVDMPPELMADVATARLRSDIWDAFVDWNDDFRRFWDRETSRAFFVPADAGWVPAQVRVDRYVEIHAATMQAQLGWMATFADGQAPPSTVRLREALDSGAPRGAFRRELKALNLLPQWRAALRAHILHIVQEWAEDNSIAASVLVDNVPSRSGQPANADAPRSMATTPRPGTSLPAQPSDLQILRTQIHRVVDAMSEEDLRALPLRGEHLLGL